MFQVIERFKPDISTKAALDSLLIALSADFRNKYPETNKFDWYVHLFILLTVSNGHHDFRGNINIHAHENRTKFSSLHNFDHTLPLSELYQTKFLKKKIGGQKKLEAREIEIWFTYQKSDIVRHLNYHRLRDVDTNSL